MGRSPYISISQFPYLQDGYDTTPRITSKHGEQSLAHEMHKQKAILSSSVLSETPDLILPP